MTATAKNRALAFLVAAFLALFMLGICSPQAAYALGEEDETEEITNDDKNLDDLNPPAQQGDELGEDPDTTAPGTPAGTNADGQTTEKTAIEPTDGEATEEKKQDPVEQPKQEAESTESADNKDVDDDLITLKTGDGKEHKISTQSIIKVQSTPVSKATTSGSAYAAGKGWTTAATSGKTIGTTGQSRRLEALKLSLANMGDNKGNIHYQVHMQNRGWMGTVSNGNTAGLPGSGLRMEAAKIWLSGDISRHYDVYYKGHVQNVGWQSWARNGGVTGTTGRSLRLEALQVILSPKTEEAAGRGNVVGVRYADHVQNVGWQTWTGDGAEIGTHGRSLRMEALNLVLSTGGKSGGISYQAHVENIGWQTATSNGGTAGTTGQSKRMEAIKIWLTGDIAKSYDVYYQTHCQNYGWLGWASNGAAAGTSGGSLRMEAIRVVVQKKGTKAPGSTSRPYVEIKETPQMRYVNRAAGVVRWIGSSTNYMIAVDLSNHWLTIFRGSAGNWTPYKNWQVSTGAPDTPTVTGDFTVGSRGYVFGHGYSCYYWTQFYGDYLFHSIKYDEGTFNVQDGRLGRSISMGCVRMAIGNAEWIYDNIPSGTHVKTFW